MKILFPEKLPLIVNELPELIVIEDDVVRAPLILIISLDPEVCGAILLPDQLVAISQSPLPVKV